MTLSEANAARVRAYTQGLARSCAKMPPSRFLWQPKAEGLPGRSASAQLGECAVMNQWAASCLRERMPVTADTAELARQRFVNHDQEEVLARLNSSASELATEVAALPEELWAGSTLFPFTEATCTWAEFLDFFVWNMAYHTGQVNYIQTLYSDEGFPDGETYRLLHGLE